MKLGSRAGMELSHPFRCFFLQIDHIKWSRPAASLPRTIIWWSFCDIVAHHSRRDLNMINMGRMPLYFGILVDEGILRPSWVFENGPLAEAGYWCQSIQEEERDIHQEVGELNQAQSEDAYWYSRAIFLQTRVAFSPYIVNLIETLNRPVWPRMGTSKLGTGPTLLNWFSGNYELSPRNRTIGQN